MFELFKRVKTVVSAELHSIIDKAEDPVVMIEQYLREMNQEIVEAEKATAKMMAEEKLLSRKIEEAKLLTEKRESQAIEALKSNREDLAKRALQDKKHVLEELDQLISIHQKTAQLVVDLKDKLKVMKAEWRELELKRDSLKSRAQAAKSKTSINRSLSTSNTMSARKGFQRMEEKVLQSEALADTTEELQTMNKSLEQELKDLGGESEIDIELQRLKDQLNQ
ncbi:PspA/IM30 family protein [Bacillus sp. 2205SS5-2]|uniref:PspA/IM30 family protein n=1 Tax=Bacillus sp. 2205SS5-2 TaxID=3109031 RepID=UPI0030070561